jgi:uncharacterized protein YegL
MQEHGKIDALNGAVRSMIQTFQGEDTRLAQIEMAIIAFGHGSAWIHRELQPVTQDMVWQDMEAKGRTPMGAALSLAHEMLEDRNRVSSRAYAPTLVLVSDGVPTDEWKEPLEQLLSSERASKAARFAMAIGDDADVAMLKQFLADPYGEVYMAHEARQIVQFFQQVTMSVSLRSRSGNPNAIAQTDVNEIDF